MISKEIARSARDAAQEKLERMGVVASYGITLDPADTASWAVAVCVERNPRRWKIPAYLTHEGQRVSIVSTSTRMAFARK